MITLSASATANWRLNYNTFDLELGRAFFFKDRVCIRPLFGFRGGILDQKYKTNVPAVAFSILGVDATLKAKGDNQYTGAGIRGGALIRWDLNPHLGIMGKFSGSVLIGEFDLTANVFTDVDVSLAGIDASLVGNTSSEGTFL